MAGRGPVPKRTSQRRRVNKPEVPIERAPAAERVPVPPANPGWHPYATLWYGSLALSGQARWYEPSDWAQALVAADVLHRMLTAPRISAPLLAAWLQMTTGLLATEGDRRRMRIELERGAQVDPDAEHADAVVLELMAGLEA